MKSDTILGIVGIVGVVSIISAGVLDGVAPEIMLVGILACLGIASPRAARMLVEAWRGET